jgi:hypothetical protein
MGIDAADCTVVGRLVAVPVCVCVCVCVHACAGAWVWVWVWLWVCEVTSLSSSSSSRSYSSLLLFVLTLSRYLGTHTHTGINTHAWATQVKTLLNEFVAYLELVHDETLSPRSVAVATYALCGFRCVWGGGVG